MNCNGSISVSPITNMLNPFDNNMNTTEKYLKNPIKVCVGASTLRRL
jgi:hypothetical protein